MTNPLQVTRDWTYCSGNAACGCTNCPECMHHQTTSPAPRVEDEAERQMDWVQVRLNGGPPCFAVVPKDNPGYYCGRAQRWDGHDSHHAYVSLGAALRAAERRGMERAAEHYENLADDLHAEGDSFGPDKALTAQSFYVRASQARAHAKAIRAFVEAER